MMGRRVSRHLARRIAGVFLACTLIGLTLAWPSDRSAVPTAYGQTAGALAVVGVGGAELYDAPDGAVLQALGLGATLTATARTADSQWIQVATEDGATGWAKVTSLVLFGVSTLPIAAQADAPAAAAPTPAATEEPAAEQASPATPAATATATATPTSTVTPTPIPPTPTPTPTSTATPTPVPPTPTPIPPTPTRGASSPLASAIAVVGSSGATLYTAPDGAAGALLSIGTALTATGRSAESDWLFVTDSVGAEGWVPRTDVVVFNISGLPVMEAVAEQAVAAEPTIVPAEETAAVATSAATSAAQEETPAVDPTDATATPSVSAAKATLRPTPVVDAGDITATNIVKGVRLNVRSGPGTTYAIVARSQPGESFLARGRNSDGSWVQIAVPEVADGLGWVSANLVLVSDPIVNLPVVESSAAPVAPPPTTAPDAPTSTAPPVAPRATGPTGLSGKLVIQDGRGSLYVYALATGALTFLTNGYEPEVTADGQKVAFTRYGSEPGIYSINIDGSDERRLFGEREFISSPKWSPDGAWIVFSRDAGEYKCHNLGSFLGCQSERRFCPFGFPCLPNDLVISLPQFMLARVDQNGENYRDLSSLNSARSPDWNAAGILYDAATSIEITEDKSDGETKRVLIGQWVQDADWQPNGGRIVYQGREGSHTELFAVNPDGTGMTALTRPVTTLVKNLPSNVSPAWSPDGQQIVYLSSRDADNDRGDWRIWVMNADGSNQRPLPIEMPIEYGFANEQMVSWGQ